MTSKPYAYLLALIAAYLAILTVYATTRAPVADHIDADNVALVQSGRTVYASHCAACHGAKLEGQPDWRRPGSDGRMPAPPHDESGHTWHHADSYLIQVVERGIVAGVDRPPDYQGNMPAFGTLLSRQETVAVLSFIKSHWSFDYRAWQERASAADRH